MTVGLFVAGEALILGRADSGHLLLAKYLRIGDPARITQLVGKHIRRGLEAAGVPRDSVRESVTEGQPSLKWRVGLVPDASLLQTNYAITKCLHDQGAEVLSGREHSGRDGASLVTLVVGLPHRPTHEVVLVRAPSVATAAPGHGRLALVLFGFGDDPTRAQEFFVLPLAFAVALAPGAESSPELFRAARARGREVVLHLPLEPINFPQVNPGPGTILVTMKPLKIAGMLRRYLDEAGPVAAVANNMGSLATQDLTVMKTVYQELKRRHLPFLHVAPAVGSVCKPLAADLGVEYDQPDALIEAEARKDNPKALDARWNEVLEEARAGRHMVVMLRATPLTRKWLPGALASTRLKDVGLVPLSSLLKKPAAL